MIVTGQTRWPDALDWCELRHQSTPGRMTDECATCTLVDADGVEVFAGWRWPASWLYMHDECGLAIDSDVLSGMRECVRAVA